MVAFLLFVKKPSTLLQLILISIIMLFCLSLQLQIQQFSLFNIRIDLNKGVYYMSSSGLNKQIIKLGQMLIDQKQIFWQMDHCYALIPIVQIQDGHILITTYRNVPTYTQLKPVEVFDLSLTISFVSKALQSYHGCNATNIHIQNCQGSSDSIEKNQQQKQDIKNLNQMIVHIIPRKSADQKLTENIYEQLYEYPQTLVKHYNQKMNFYVNAYANKILEGIHQQSKKYQSHFKMCYKEQKQN